MLANVLYSKPILMKDEFLSLVAITFLHGFFNDLVLLLLVIVYIFIVNIILKRLVTMPRVKRRAKFNQSKLEMG